jgi:hypothetical protein
LGVVGGDGCSLLPAALPRQVQKFLPPLVVPSDDGDCGVERITIAEVRIDHRKVTLDWQGVRCGFLRPRKSDSPGILFSDFLQRTEIMSAFEGRDGVSRADADFSDMPPPAPKE